MATGAGTAFKIRRLQNDVNAIYDMLGNIQKTQREHGGVLKQLAAGQDQIWATLVRHEARLDAHGAKLDTILDLLRGSQTGGR